MKNSKLRSTAAGLHDPDGVSPSRQVSCRCPSPAPSYPSVSVRSSAAAPRAAAPGMLTPVVVSMMRSVRSVRVVVVRVRMAVSRAPRTVRAAPAASGAPPTPAAAPPAAAGPARHVQLSGFLQLHMVWRAGLVVRRVPGRRRSNRGTEYTIRTAALGVSMAAERRFFSLFTLFFLRWRTTSWLSPPTPSRPRSLRVTPPSR